MIIGLTGKKQAGKDTVADYLVENYGFTKIGFADQLYEAVCVLFDITREQADRWKVDGASVYWAYKHQWPSVTLTNPLSMREILQRFGTEVGREVFGEHFWVERFIERYFDKLSEEAFGQAKFVVRDVRFNNEALALNELGADIWHVSRPDTDDGDTHESELGIHEGHIKGWLHNDTTIDEFHTMLKDWMKVAYGL